MTRHILLAVLAAAFASVTTGTREARAQWQLVLLAGAHTVEPVLASGTSTELMPGEYTVPPSEPFSDYFILAQRGDFMHPSLEAMAQDGVDGSASASTSGATASASGAAGGAVTVVTAPTSSWHSYGGHALTLVTDEGSYQCPGAQITESEAIEGLSGPNDPRLYNLRCSSWEPIANQQP